MKTIREMCADWSRECSIKELVTALEAREKELLAERDAAEEKRRLAEVERVIAAFKASGCESGWSLVLAQLYPPPKPEKLPAGWYGIRNKDGKESVK